MSKLGVGVGEDFPLDDGNGGSQGQNQGSGQGGQGPQTPPDERAEYEEWKRRREQWRAQREEWRRRRDEWHARKRAFKERMRKAAYESFGPDWDGRTYRRPHFWPLGAFGLTLGALVLAVPILLLVLFFSLISAAFKAPFVVLGVIALAFVLIGWRHRYRSRHYFGHGPHSGYGPYDYDLDLKPSRRGPPQSPQQPPPGNPPPSPPQATGK